jgi:capsular exopolysaccharide synthesis family protein
LCTLLGVGIAVALSLTAQPTYQSDMTFFVASAADRANTPLQADEFAQRRINSYVGVINSDRLADMIIRSTALPLTSDELSKMISASADPETVLLHVTVTDVSAERSLVIARSIATNLDKAIGELDNRGAQSAVQLRVISGPRLNPFPVTPRKKLNLALGLVIGLGVGVAQALLRQQMDTSMRSREQLAEVTGLPTLAQLHAESTAKSAPILPPHASRSRRGEVIRQLRTNLRFVDAASPVKVLVVTSSREGEGKSTTAANLAQSFAESGRKVLLVDADLRKPRLQRYLDLEGSIGLTSVLIGDADMSQVVQAWGPDGLEVLASGPIPPNPSELLGSAAMEWFVSEVRAEYELVIIDTPPLLPVTDGAVTSVLADGVILLVRYGKTSRDDVRHSLDALESVDARVLGTVLFMTPSGRTDRLPSYYDDPPRVAELAKAAEKARSTEQAQGIEQAGSAAKGKPAEQVETTDQATVQQLADTVDNSKTVDQALLDQADTLEQVTIQRTLETLEPAYFDESPEAVDQLRPEASHESEETLEPAYFDESPELLYPLYQPKIQDSADTLDETDPRDERTSAEARAP